MLQKNFFGVQHAATCLTPVDAATPISLVFPSLLPTICIHYYQYFHKLLAPQYAYITASISIHYYREILAVFTGKSSRPAQFFLSSVSDSLTQLSLFHFLSLSRAHTHTFSLYLSCLFIGACFVGLFISGRICCLAIQAFLFSPLLGPWDERSRRFVIVVPLSFSRQLIVNS